MERRDGRSRVDRHALSVLSCLPIMWRVTRYERRSANTLWPLGDCSSDACVLGPSGICGLTGITIASVERHIRSLSGAWTCCTRSRGHRGVAPLDVPPRRCDSSTMRLPLRSSVRTAGRVSVPGLCSVVALCFAGIASAGAASWSVVPSPGTGNLDSVSCTSASACTAVGYEQGSPDGPTHQLARRWNGVSWSVEPLPLPPGGQNDFSDVSCGSPVFCVAAWTPSSPVTGKDSGFVGTWQGSSWSIRKPSGGDITGDGLSCISSRFCVMFEELRHGTLAEAWNGSRWSPMASTRRLSGVPGPVSCISATSCVGIVGLSSVRWNGKAWATLAPLDTRFVTDASWGFRSLSCSSAKSCAVVGFAGQDCSCASLSFVERWDGAHWSEQTATATYLATLTAVACKGPKTCIAVGSDPVQSVPPTQSGFAERWMGTRWSAQPMSSPAGAYLESVQGISCPGATCIAVGSWVPSTMGPPHTLVEQYR